MDAGDEDLLRIEGYRYYGQEASAFAEASTAAVSESLCADWASATGSRTDRAALFAPAHWGSMHCSFLLGEEPPTTLVSNVNIVAFVGDDRVVLRLENGEWEVPGTASRRRQARTVRICRTRSRTAWSAMDKSRLPPCPCR